MGLFRRNRASAETSPGPAGRDLGSGRDLASTLALDDVLAIVGDLARGYSTKRHSFMPSLLPARCGWSGAGSAPGVTVAFDDPANTLVVAAFWSTGQGTRAALFPTSDGADRLLMPTIGHWKMQDPSLRSVGTIPAGSLYLRPPAVDRPLLASVIERAGHPPHDANIRSLEEEFARMASVKAHQFIASADPAAARRFVDAHRGASPSTILEDLGTWNPGVIPFVQDLPFRVASILLERDTAGRPGAAVWTHMVA